MKACPNSTVNSRDEDIGADLLARAQWLPGDGVARPGAQDVVPELAALLVGPRVGALADRDHELRRLLQEAQQLGFGGFHFADPFLDAFFVRFADLLARLVVALPVGLALARSGAFRA